MRIFCIYLSYIRFVQGRAFYETNDNLSQLCHKSWSSFFFYFGTDKSWNKFWTFFIASFLLFQWIAVCLFVYNHLLWMKIEAEIKRIMQFGLQFGRARLISWESSRDNWIALRLGRRLSIFCKTRPSFYPRIACELRDCGWDHYERRVIDVKSYDRACQKVVRSV